MLPEQALAERLVVLDQIIGAITKAIRTIEAKNAKGAQAGYVREPDIEWRWDEGRGTGDETGPDPTGPF